ncbi:MAG: DUF5615 family PIN-like protein [Rhodothermales bacterium]|nr:DUF5615 family PIN-like protein [Rhodothermales bacterium]MBO6778995.1 DUF5615 family PIN-like protein [Rhodothermales bacterium]
MALLKLKLDENLPASAKAIFREQGHDARTVHDQGLEGIKDRTLSVVCRAEGRVLVTLDLDFADIRRYPPHETPGTIVLRAGRQSLRRLRRMCSFASERMTRFDPSGQLWVIDSTGLRTR